MKCPERHGSKFIRTQASRSRLLRFKCHPSTLEANSRGKGTLLLEQASLSGI